MSSYSIIGAGNGGLALAGYIASKGKSVSLYNRTPDKIDGIRKIGGIYLTNFKTKKKAFLKLNNITSNLEDIADSETIIICTPATAHKEIAQNISPYIQKGQTIILSPGRSFGAVEFFYNLKTENKNNVDICETQTLLFACRNKSDIESIIYGIKKTVDFASLHSNRTSKILTKLKSVFPQFNAADNLLTVALSNIGCIFHPTIFLLNISRIENKIPFLFYKDGASKSVCKIIEILDRERISIARYLDQNTYSALRWLQKSYNTKAKTLYKAIQTNPAYTEIIAPSVLNHRYIEEDVSTGLVPLLSIAKEFEIKTPIMEALVSLASKVNGVDYYEAGRNLKNLGLSKLNKGSFIKYFS